MVLNFREIGETLGVIIVIGIAIKPESFINRISGCTLSGPEARGQYYFKNGVFWWDQSIGYSFSVNNGIQIFCILMTIGLNRGLLFLDPPTHTCTDALNIYSFVDWKP